MSPQAPNVSVTLPVSQAVERARDMLFRPFRLEKWFAIGFCAWLAHLGQQGFHGTFGGGGRRGNVDMQGWLRRAHEYVLNNLYWLVPVAAAALVLGLVLWVVVVWVSSRGKFMFLNCVARDAAEVTAPWQNYAREANSLFWFRLALGGINLLIVLLTGAGIGLLIWNIARRGAGAGNIVALIVLGGILLLGCIVIAIIAKLTTDFVVPILFLRGGTCLAGWEILRGLLTSNPGGFVLYILFQILLSLAIGASILALVLVTCCVAGCFLAIPYLGTVLLLPILVFQRAYSIFYLRQYGPDFDVLVSPGGPAPLARP